MPYAFEQRQKFFGNPKQGENPSASFAHYTSADAALKILQGKRLWMRNAICMSDYREVQHGFDIFRNFFAEKGNESAFTKALDNCAPGAGEEAIKIFNQWWNDIRFNTYIASFSEHDPSEDLHGRLSMWRGFGGGSNPRVALVFKVPWLLDPGVKLHTIVSPVAYLRQVEVHKVIHDVIEKIHAECEFLRSMPRPQVVAMAFTMLMAGVVCLKHEGFREEREWRAIYAPKRWPSDLIESSTEVVAGVPQLIHKLPLDGDFDLTRILDRVIIGPSAFPWVMWEAFVAALTAAEITNAGERVFVSDIPIRT